MTIEFIINHLWQSSCFALLAGLLAWLLRNNSPKVRYWVWLAASLKFLVPFGLLVSVGSLVPRPVHQPVSLPTPVFSNSLVQIAEPLSINPQRPHTPLHWMPATIGIVWVLGLLAIALVRYRAWLQVQVALRSGVPVDLPIPVRALITPGVEEPGIVGFLRPVLVLPAQLLERLNASQLKALLAHELSHVRRRDNFFAALHMAVEAIFWFHPLVWWIGSRMLDERELACDEEVLRLGCEPADYVQGILTVCKHYSEAPLPCVSGVTGADIKKRLKTILRGTLSSELNRRKKLALAIAAIAAIAAPVGIGILTAPVIQAQNAPANTPKFDVASVKPCSAPLNDGGPHSSPGRLATDCAQLLNLIGNAYNTFADGHLNLNAEPAPITGGPPWIHTASYDINAKAEGNPSKEMMFGPMMQALLEDRFQLKIHRQTSEGPVYFVTVARGGPKLQPFIEGSCTLYYGFPRPPLAPGQTYCERTISGLKPSVQADGATLDEFSKMLRMVVGRPVIDKTGISGRFNLLVKFSREGTELAGIQAKDPPASDPGAPPSIFTALQEQLGLKLESGRGPVDMLVIDHIEKPSEN